MHKLGFETGSAGPNVANYNTFTVSNLECITTMIYPKSDFIESYMMSKVA